MRGTIVAHGVADTAERRSAVGEPLILSQIAEEAADFILVGAVLWPAARRYREPARTGARDEDAGARSDRTAAASGAEIARDERGSALTSHT